MDKILIRILFMLVIFWAFTSEASDKTCLNMIEAEKREPAMGAIGRSSSGMDFWSHSTRPGVSECYYRIKDKKTGLKKRLEKMGYRVSLGDYSGVCTEFCYVANVDWSAQKNLGLNKREREKVAAIYEEYTNREASACVWAMTAGKWDSKPNYEAAKQCRDRRKKQNEFMLPCLRKTGNIGACFDKFYQLKEKKK